MWNLRSSTPVSSECRQPPVRRAARTFVALAMASLVGACQAPSEPQLKSAGYASGHLISDATHNGGTPGFFFLPPLVPATTYGSIFQSGLKPVVQIDEMTINGSVTTWVTIATYTTSSGPGGVTVKEGSDHYLVNWQTKQFALNPAVTYRVRVLVDGFELGFADVDVVDSGSQLRNVNNDQYIPLLDDRTLPIKFRVQPETLGGAHRPTDLGTLGGKRSEPRAINNSGQVVGSSETSLGTTHAFSWDVTGGLTDLGTLGGATSQAVDVNTNGEVTGTSGTANGQTHPFFWTPASGLIDVDPDGTRSSAPYAISEAGRIQGELDNSEPGIWRLFWWDAISGFSTGRLFTFPLTVFTVNAVNHSLLMVGSQSAWGSGTSSAFWFGAGRNGYLGTLGGQSCGGTAVSENGQFVAGSGQTDLGQWHAFAWSETSGMVDLGTLGGSESHATSINDLNQIVGYSETISGATHAFSWTAAGGMKDLGTLGGQASKAVAINEIGQVVGNSQTATGEWHAFAWTEAGGMVGLGTLGGSASAAIAINENGQIAGYSNTPGDLEVHAVVWKIVGP